MKSISPWLSTTLYLLLASTPVFAQEVFFVDPSGLDSNAGTVELPLRTFEGAVQKVRTVVDGTGDIVVNFNTGTYLFTDTVVLGPADSGTANQSITYRATPGQSPVFSSLLQVTGWSVFDGNIMQAPLPPPMSHVRYLQDNSENWMERSATEAFSAQDEPSFCIECTWDEPEVQAAKSNIQYPAGFSAVDWSFADQYDLRESTHGWTLEVLPIASASTGQRRIFTTIPALYEMRRDNSEDDIPNNNWVLNSIEGIDTPGEWASLNGTLYLWPASGTDDIYVPQLTELIRIDAGGDGNTWTGTPVQYIHFQGITFTGGDFYIMKEGDVTVQHDWSVVDQATALLRFRNAANSSVSQCTFSKSGSTGIRLDRYAQDIGIANNTFSYLGREAIVLSGRGPGYGDVNKNNTISLNHISAMGREKWTAPAILVDQSSGNTIRSNYLTDTYYTALALTGPRQLAMASVAEFSPNLLTTVREFHYQEFSPATISLVQGFDDVLFGSREGMQHVYNVNNRVEDNAFIDVSQGQGFLFNGYVYISGVQRNGTNFVERNYVFDSKDNLQNNMVFYSDSDQDNADYIGNMIHNVQVGDPPAPFPAYNVFAQWAELDPPDNAPSGSIRVTASAVRNSTHSNYIEGLNFVENGTITDGVGGNASFLDTYQQMYQTLCPDANIPGSPWPSSDQFSAMLASKIVELGGNQPSCGTSVALPEKLYFAQFGDGQDQIFSQIVLINLDTSTPAQANIILRGGDGQPLSVDLNGNLVEGQLSIEIPAGGLRVLATDGKGPQVVGSVTVCSDRPLAGVILFGGVVGLAGVGASVELPNGFVAPIKTNETNQINTGIAVVNLLDQLATVNLQLCDTEGQTLATGQLELAGNGHRALFVNEITWSVPVDFENFRGLLKAAVPTSIAATVIQTRPGEFATLPVAPQLPANAAAVASTTLGEDPDEALEELFYAQFGDGLGQLFSQIQLFNLNTLTAANATILIRDDEGAPLTVDLNGTQIDGELDIVIPPGGLRTLQSDGVGPQSVGWVTVTSDLQLAGVILFGGSVGVAGVASSDELPTGFVAPIETNSQEVINTGIALVNLEPQAVTVALRLCDSDGTELATGELTLAALGHRALFVNEIEWSAAVDFSNFQGLLKATVATPIAATVIQTRPEQFATQPVAEQIELYTAP